MYPLSTVPRVGITTPPSPTSSLVTSADTPAPLSPRVSGTLSSSRITSTVLFRQCFPSVNWGSPYLKKTHFLSARLSFPSQCRYVLLITVYDLPGARYAFILSSDTPQAINVRPFRERPILDIPLTRIQQVACANSQGSGVPRAHCLHAYTINRVRC